MRAFGRYVLDDTGDPVVVTITDDDLVILTAFDSPYGSASAANLTAGQARSLAGVLGEAADVLDALTE